MADSHEMTRKNWYNVVILGVGFFLLFSGFQTTAFVQTISISSFLDPKCRSANANGSQPHEVVDGGIHITHNFANKIGYISLCIIYGMVALFNWVSVSIVALVGPKVSLIISALLYCVYIAALIRPYVPMVFIGAAILGAAGGVLWTAQGQILIQNSSKEKMATTSGLFWFMLESSLVFGNFVLFVLLRFFNSSHEQDCIAHEDNYYLFGVLTALGLAGAGMFLLLRPVSRLPTTAQQQESLNSSDSEEKSLLSSSTSVQNAGGRNLPVVLKAVVDAFKMLFTSDMLLLSICFIYTGYELNFWSGVYGTVIGNTRRFPYYHIGLAGMFIGLGEILGGGLFGILGRYTNKWGRDPIVLLGMLVHFLTFLLVFYNLPSEASLKKVSEEDSQGYLFDPSILYLAHFCAFLLGFADSCFNTQIYSILGALYPTDDRSAPAMALFKFFQSLAAMVGFLTSALVQLQWQLLVLTILGVAGTLSFAVVEWKHYRHAPMKEPKLQEQSSK